MNQNAETVQKAIEGSLSIIEQEREKEIISRRFGLTGHKETLEQIGEMLSITRERVRQLEKAILIRLRITAEDGGIPDLAAAEKLLVRNLTELGRVARISDLAEKLFGSEATVEQKAALAFLGDISPVLSVVEENDNYHAALGIAEYGSTKELKAKADEIVSIIKKNKAPMTLDELDQNLNYEHPDHIRAVASISKLLSSLNGLWGLAKWPTVNSKNIRDKIFVVLESKKEPMHFADIIKDIMAKAGEPLSREEIVKRVLRSRKVKETTILLNLQNKKYFHKVDKNTYELAENA